MTTTKPCRYRGYDIVPTRQWSSWCVGVYPTRADLPLFSRLFCIPWRHDGKTLWPRLSRASIASFRASLAGSLSALWRDLALASFGA
jgi:hypothetical protein